MGKHYNAAIVFAYLALILVGFLVFLAPAKASTGQLTREQVTAVLELLQVFGVDNQTLQAVEDSLTVSTARSVTLEEPAEVRIQAPEAAEVPEYIFTPQQCYKRHQTAVYGPIPGKTGKGWQCKTI